MTLSSKRKNTSMITSSRKRTSYSKTIRKSIITILKDSKLTIAINCKHPSNSRPTKSTFFRFSSTSIGPWRRTSRIKWITWTSLRANKSRANLTNSSSRRKECSINERRAWISWRGIIKPRWGSWILKLPSSRNNWLTSRRTWEAWQTSTIGCSKNCRWSYNRNRS